jgi:hypothetical protein
MDYEHVKMRCLTDEVLSRKVEHMKALLRNFSAHYDDLFWDRMQTRKDQIARIKGRNKSN